MGNRCSNCFVGSISFDVCPVGAVKEYMISVFNGWTAGAGGTSIKELALIACNGTMTSDDLVQEEASRVLLGLTLSKISKTSLPLAELDQ
ncbi:hypothetical protein CEXT_614601 [Caerostris extrusa]|uniref:Uncharacterized protein n=1 Tax=Caerostris extrusa TaxID=172846 RepID=A0AAV4VMT6_CAEEX|nr:hypothetical protein CEXT_614601 [Caerostris extrusa]